jgi:hypothetical protein
LLSKAKLQLLHGARRTPRRAKRSLPLEKRRQTGQWPAMDNSRIFEAIALRRCLAARYNKLALVLAPHVLYRRNDSYFVDAVTITRDGAEPREPKVGSYNLAGLSALEVLDATFDCHPLFNRMDPKYRDNTLFMIDAD